MSSFPDEQETLLFGNFNQMIISNIYLMNDIDNNRKHKLMVKVLNQFEKLIENPGSTCLDADCTQRFQKQIFYR